MKLNKFKAWDTVEKKWLWITGFKTKETSESNGYTLDGIFHDGDYVGIENIIVVQYTGVKDKDGKEVYEGDIVGDHIGTGIVEFKHAGFRVNYKDGYCKWFFDYLASEYKTIEIIGNIYEKPELLSDRI